MINIRLGIHAIGFQRWQNNFMGILITPWFMNLVLLPVHEDDWSDMVELSKHSHAFPSGVYEFLVCYDSDIGYYQICSLFSPMFEFPDDAVAIETAEIVLPRFHIFAETQVIGFMHHLAKRDVAVNSFRCGLVNIGACE